MKRILLLFLFLISLFFQVNNLFAQVNQTVTNGSTTTPVNFPGGGCVYNWVNDTPGIGLPASGTGDIPAFTAVNTGSSPVKANITATPVNATFAYIANWTDSSISVINIATNKIAATIPVGIFPFGVSVSPDGSRIYVTNALLQIVSVINTSNNSVIATVNVGVEPYGIAVSPDGSRVYVANATSSSVYVINTTSNSLLASIDNIGASPYGIAVSPDSKTVYTSTNSGYVSVINATTNTVLTTITVGSFPEGLVVSPDGNRLYVANSQSGSLSVVNTATNTVTNTIPVGLNPSGVSISPDGKTVYVANYNSNSVSVVNTSTNTVTKNVSVGTSPQGISVSLDGVEVFVTNQNSNNVSVINAATNTVTATIAVGKNPGGIAIGLGTGCNSTPVTLTYSVNPTPPPTITASLVTGNITTCQGSASANPNIQQFTISGSNLTGNIIAAAPTGFELSLTPYNGFGNSVSLAQTLGSVNNGVIYVRLASSATAGNKSGNVILASTGALNQNVPVNGTVNALPVANSIGNQSVTNTAATTAINFTGTANTYNWVNDSPSIGLPASGTGNIPSFIATNNGTSIVKATITVKPINAAFAYVANAGDNTVSVVNTASDTVVNTIPVGNSPQSISFNPDYSRAYVANYGSGTVSVISTLTNTVVSTIDVGATPRIVYVSPDGNRIYILNDVNIKVIDAKTNIVIATIVAGNLPLGIVESPDGSQLFVTNQNDNNISIINTATNAVINSVPVGIFPIGITESSDGKMVYVVNSGFSGNGSVSVINTATDNVVATIPVGLGPTSAVLSPDASRLYVTNAYDNSVSVINTATNLPVATVKNIREPIGISISSDGHLLYVTNYSYNTITVIDASTNTVTNVITVGLAPYCRGNFLTNTAVCDGMPVTFSISVNPIPPTQPVITASTAIGNIFSCLGIASSNPFIRQFTVSGYNLTSVVTAAAPPGGNFEISLNSDQGYGNSLTISPSAGKINNTVIYVRSSATASGTLSDNISLSSPGAIGRNVQVTAIVNDLPTVANNIPNQTVLNGNPTNLVEFTGTANTFTWTNDMPSIGLPAYGTGNIPVFNAVNNSDKPVTATITATPVMAGYAYIANNANGTVDVVNTITDSVVSIIPVGDAPSAVSVSPDGSRVYVANWNSNNVSVINTASNSVIATIPAGDTPLGLVVSPDGTRVYVSNSITNSVTVIDAATNSVVSIITVGPSPYGICVSPDGNFVYTTILIDSSVAVINTHTNKVVANITVGFQPVGICVSPDGSRVYVTNTTPETVSVIDTKTNSVITNISDNQGIGAGGGPVEVVVSPDGSRLYISNQLAGNISVVNTLTNGIIATLDTKVIGADAFGISLNPDGSRLYVSTSTNVVVFNTLTGNIIANFKAGPSPSSIGNFITSGISCEGQPVSFKITVEPSPQITASTIGNITICSGTSNSGSYNLQIIVSGSNLTDNIIAAAPSGFEISLDPNSGFTNSLLLKQSGGFVQKAIVYARLTTPAPTATINGDLVLTSLGATTQNISLNGFVNPVVIPALSISGSSNNICEGSQVIFNANETNAGSAPVYQWLLNGVNTGTNSSTYSSSTLVNGDMVSCSLINNDPCAIPATATSNSITMIVNQSVTPAISINASNNNVCEGTPITFLANAIGGGNSPVYQWLLNGVSVGTNSSTFTGDSFTNGDNVICTLSSNATCITSNNTPSNQIELKINPLPVVDAGGNKTIKDGSSIQLNAKAPVDLKDITWTPATGLSNNKILNPFASPTITTNYTLTVQTASDCIGTDNITITVFNEIEIPNTFTPNGDGINDTWVIKYLDAYPNCTVKVYNRYGEMVYSSIGYGVPWDGKYNGTNLPQGTYYYIINLNNGSKILSGSVTIIR